MKVKMIQFDPISILFLSDLEQNCQLQGKIGTPTIGCRLFRTIVTKTTEYERRHYECCGSDYNNNGLDDLHHLMSALCSSTTQTFSNW